MSADVDDRARHYARLIFAAAFGGDVFTTREVEIMTRDQSASDRDGADDSGQVDRAPVRGRRQSRAPNSACAGTTSRH